MSDVDRDEKIRHLRACLDTGFERLTNARKLFNAAHADTVVAREKLHSAEKHENEAFKVIGVAQSDILGWLEELRRLV